MGMFEKPGLPQPYVFVPRSGKPQLLFVLLHGEDATPRQLFPLADAIKQAFPASMVVLPYAFENRACPGAGQVADAYFWVDPVELHAGNQAERMQKAVASLIAEVRAIQQAYGLSGQQTALAGFSQGATLALEAVHERNDLAGRVLAFSGAYTRLPEHVPPATVLHFFHGAQDDVISVREIEASLKHLGELQADATLDIASGVGHTLHEALVNQAVVRLQTCVPLRSWEAAFASLDEAQHQEGQSRSPGPGDTLH
ncbi:esterase [Paracandidimonas lactea]|uniref:esterase n=1 Tax=Paracandidimonas lactea TaxID=2895524 RepID=UPI001F42BD15|nr:esterase [Paracandidimonas lactea]